MFTQLLLLLIFCCVSKQLGVVDHKQHKKLTAHEVRETIDNVISEDYIKELAKQFAEKAAAHFMAEINNKKKSLFVQLKPKRNSHSDYRTPAQGKKKKTYHKSKVVKKDLSHTVNVMPIEEVNEPPKPELDDAEALRLIEAPSPDGDHLDSSGELTDEKKNKIPVIQLTKINGIYYRRLLGMI